MGNTSKLLILFFRILYSIYSSQKHDSILFGFHIFTRLCAPFLFFFSDLVCVLGEPRSQPCPRTPEPFRTPGPDGNKHPPSVWFIDHSPPDHTHTHTNTLKKASHMGTYESTPVDSWRWKIYLKECSSCTHKKKKKMCSGKCVHREIRYENAYRGGRNSFDMIRMVEKNNGWQRKIKGAGAE